MCFLDPADPQKDVMQGIEAKGHAMVLKAG